MLELGNENSCQNIAIAGTSTDLSGGTIPTTFTARGAIRISICLDTATSVKVRFTPTGGSPTNFTLFDGGSLVADCPRTCILKLPEGTVFTVRFGAACTVQWATFEQVTGGMF